MIGLSEYVLTEVYKFYTFNGYINIDIKSEEDKAQAREKATKEIFDQINHQKKEKIRSGLTPLESYDHLPPINYIYKLFQEKDFKKGDISTKIYGIVGDNLESITLGPERKQLINFISHSKEDVDKAIRKTLQHSTRGGRQSQINI